MPTTITIPTAPVVSLPSRELLTADRIYYVAASGGSDSNTGLSVGQSFATIQHAIDVVANLDLGLFQATIQLADGTHQLLPHYTDAAYDGIGLLFKDPVGGIPSAPYAEDLFSTVKPCTLRGNPANPAACIIQDTAVFVPEFAGNYGNFQILYFEYSHKWQVNGVKLVTPTPGSTAVESVWLFNASAELVNIDFCGAFSMLNFVYAYTSFVQLKTCRISALVGATVLSAFRADQGSIWFSEGVFNCQSATVTTGTFIESVGTSYMYCQETYSNAANIANLDYKYYIGFQAFMSVANPNAFPGAASQVGYLSPGSQILNYGAAGVIDGSHMTVINPTGSRMGVVGAGDDLGSREGNGFTFSNEGAVSIAIFLLPGVDAGFPGPFGNHAHVYSFVVQAAAGIRVQAPAGHTLRVGNLVSAAAGKLESTTIGSTLTLRCINNSQWFSTDCMGTWSIT